LINYIVVDIEREANFQVADRRVVLERVLNKIVYLPTSKT